MPILNTHTRTTGPTKNEQFQPMGRTPAHFGVFVGFVKRADDVQRNGRLMVWIPEFGSAPDNENGWISVNYCSPFAGATNVNTTSQSNTQSFEGTQTSYGMWMIPPDINNQVIVMFLNGDPSKGIWIGSLFQQYMNNMVPAMASDVKNYQYPGKSVPIAEYNKWDKSVVYPDRTFKPYEKTKFKGLGNQGLLGDPVRGTTSTSARREAPSNVFGIITPGPAIDPDASPEKIRRKGGSSFIMDDGVGSEYVQLTTKSGAQIKIDETNGFIYLINRDGTAWVQMDKKGNVDIFGATNISMRAQRDINFRADRNINIEAGQNIFMKAAKDTKEGTTTFTYDINNVPQTTTIPEWKFVGAGAGDGGNIVMQALNNWQSTTQKNAYLTVIESNMDINVGNSFGLTTLRGSQDYSSKQGIKITTDASLDMAATGNIRVGSNGMLSVVGAKDIIMCTDASLNMKAQNNIQVAAVNDILVASTNLGVTANTLFAENVGIVGNLSVQGASHLIADYSQLAVGIGHSATTSVSPPTLANPAQSEAARSARTAMIAEVKPLNEKLNILATWTSSTPEDKFKRRSQPIQTTVSKFPTYEPCPEHETFNPVTVSTSTPILTADNNTYAGSAGAGNSTSTAPAASQDPGASNTSVKGDSTADSSVSLDLNVAAFRNQLILHEGLRKVSYADTKGLTTGGIGHLMRENEKTSYPLGTPISDSQIETWYTQDSTSAIKIAQDLMGDAWGNFSDVRKRAVADLAYNLGKSGLSKFVKFIAAMKASDFTTAGRELTNSAWYSQVGKRGPNIVTMINLDTDPTGSDKKLG